MAVVGHAATIIGLISSVIGLVILVRPDLQPDPPAPDRSAELRQLDLQPRLSFRQYLQRIDEPSTGYTTEKLAERGAFLEYRFDFRGYKGKALPVKHEMFNAETGDQVADEEPFTLEPLSPKDVGEWHAWFPLPAQRGRYYVRVQVYEPKGVIPLARIQTEPFRAG